MLSSLSTYVFESYREALWQDLAQLLPPGSYHYYPRYVTSQGNLVQIYLFPKEVQRCLKPLIDILATYVNFETNDFDSETHMNVYGASGTFGHTVYMCECHYSADEFVTEVMKWLKLMPLGDVTTVISVGCAWTEEPKDNWFTPNSWRHFTHTQGFEFIKGSGAIMEHNQHVHLSRRIGNPWIYFGTAFPGKKKYQDYDPRGCVIPFSEIEGLMIVLERDNLPCMFFDVPCLQNGRMIRKDSVRFTKEGENVFITFPGKRHSRTLCIGQQDLLELLNIFFRSYLEDDSK